MASKAIESWLRSRGGTETVAEHGRCNSPAGFISNQNTSGSQVDGGTAFVRGPRLGGIRLRVAKGGSKDERRLWEDPRLSGDGTGQHGLLGRVFRNAFLRFRNPLTRIALWMATMVSCSFGFLGVSGGGMRMGMPFAMSMGMRQEDNGLSSDRPSQLAAEKQLTLKEEEENEQGDTGKETFPQDMPASRKVHDGKYTLPEPWYKVEL